MTCATLPPAVACAADSIIRRRFHGTAPIDILSGPLNRALQLVEFSHQASDNAAFRGDEFTPAAVHGVFATLKHELQDLAALLDHISLGADREPCPTVRQVAAEDAFKALAALYLDLSPTERETLSVFIECVHNHDAQAAHVDLIRRGLRDAVNEGADDEDALDELARNEGTQA